MKRELECVKLKNLRCEKPFPGKDWWRQQAGKAQRVLWWFANCGD
jgi:hypothetical protein